VKPYILDDASAVEYKRLDLMSKILDPWTRGYLTMLGVGEGWHCLELGGGNGSIAEWLADRVGASGSVTAIDINPVLLELLPAQNLSVQQMDVRTGDLGSESYDLVTLQGYSPKSNPRYRRRLRRSYRSNGAPAQTREYPASGQAAAASGADSTLSQRPMFRRLGR
jgi:SAM-dependent methyltransferase